MILKTILYIFFKLIRKLIYSFNSCCWRMKIAYYYYISKQRFLFKNGVKAGRGFSIQSDLSNTSIFIDKQVTFRDNFHIIMGTSGKLVIGANCFFNNNCSISCLSTIKIGDETQFGENVLLYDHNHQYKDKSSLISSQGYTTGTISIGNNCWIGSNVTILKNVVIGDGVVIGAGCIIYKSVPAYSVVINHQDLVITSRV